MRKRVVDIVSYGFDAPCDMAFCSSPAKYAITTKGGPPSLFFKLCEDCMAGLREALLGMDASGAALDEAAKLMDLQSEEKILAFARAKAAAADADIADEKQDAEMADELRVAIIKLAKKHDIDVGGLEKDDAEEEPEPDKPEPEGEGSGEEPKPESEPEETFKYHCKYCGKGFNNVGKLGAHTRRCPEK